MPMLAAPRRKYSPFEPLKLPNRQWPDKTITKPPRWLATDLRDGNQSLINPMDAARKHEFFELLVKLGYREIEVAFPSASDTDFNFTREIVEQQIAGKLPDDLWIQVLTPSRPELIEKTIASVKGAKRVIVHLYNATCPLFRKVVFQHTKEETVELSVSGTKLIKQLTDAQPGTHWRFEFSPEHFTDTEPEYAVEVCNAVQAIWNPTTEDKIIFNLPATVELATPNIYADQIEYFHTHIANREKVCISLHPHNDRGTSIAAAELAQMAGADRVEGCLFGNGERTGNVDLVALGLNLYTQGIHPGIDFSNMREIVRVVEHCNQIPVHCRHPYAGDLVFTSFSGSHQDAIKKGFAVQRKREVEGDLSWDIPYLPLDPADIGCSYEAIIRVNSQSGKGGVAWVLQEMEGLELPRRLQIAFSRVVQEVVDVSSRELTGKEIVALFHETYFLQDQGNPQILLEDYTISGQGRERRFGGDLLVQGKPRKVSGVGNGPISSLIDGLKRDLDIDLSIVNYSEHSIGAGTDTFAATYVEVSLPALGLSDGVFGVGIDRDSLAASLRAILSAANAAVRPEGASTAATAKAVKSVIAQNGISSSPLHMTTSDHAITNGLQKISDGP